MKRSEDQIRMETVEVFWRAGIQKSCESCLLEKALIFCQADSAFLCPNCDANIHGANNIISRHRRQWMCVVCEQAPAVVMCNPDMATLCIACDEDVHSLACVAACMSASSSCLSPTVGPSQP